ncbi:hypothetical protein MACJ_003717 [Theileria orientalis]|uniref:Uncharacterized protein n=1 Tax=Theileria orientalis TaxID=68886 RepID=A0A976SLM9_THEOR|nr:hypothetical protein MACJ_003717 [Theileria orientalis]
MAEITIDLDKDGPYSSGIFKIEILQIPYDDCDIIDRKTHYPVGNCKLKSLKSKILGVKIENDKIFDNVSYVYVFFSTIEEKVPIVFGISTGNDNNVIYYTGFSEENQTYKLSSLKKICNENLLDDLVKESDKVNNTLTYLLDKKTSYNDIKVTRIQNQIKPEDWIFTHSPINKEKLRKSTLLLKYKKYM